MIDSLFKFVTGITRLRGRTGLIADVELIGGKHKQLVDATVTVEEVFGLDNFADTWFFILTAGAIGNTVTINIAASAVDTTSPDRDVAAYTKIYTLIAADVGDELKLRDNIVAALNADALFNPHWKAAVIKNNAIVHISSKYPGEFGERLSVAGFAVTPSGTTTTQIAFDNVKRRGKQTSLTRDPNDKRIGVLGISGEVTTTPGAVGDTIVKNFLNASSANMLVNGSVTPVTFSVMPVADKDEFIKMIRLYGNGNGIKFGQFLGANSNLTNGLEVMIRSDGNVLTLPVIKSTDDIKHKFALVSQGFDLHIQAGRDDFSADLVFDPPFPIRKIGTFTTDDFAQIKVQDNLTSAGIALEALAFGFQKET